MTAAKTEQEPSMEEILASIRRIISEEGQVQEETETEQPETPPADTEDVLELTQMVKEDGSVVSLTPGGEVAEGETEEEVEAMAEEEKQAAAEPEPTSEPAPEPEVEPEPAPEPEPEPEPAPEPKPEPEIELKAVEPTPAETEEAGGEVEPSESLVSEETVQLSTAALSALAQALAKEKVSIVGRTLEDLTKEILKPLLKEWLDVNLPSLIERLVREEIEKMVGRLKDR